MNKTDVIAWFRDRWPVAQWRSLGWFNDAFLLKINPHWMLFEPPDPQSHYALAMIYTVIMTIGVLGNCLVICMFIRRRSLRTQANILVMNLAVSDLLMMLKTPIFIYNSLHLGPALGALGCSLYGFIGGISGTVSIMTLAAISLDRYNVIVHPLVRNNRQKIYLTVLALWLYGAVFSALPLIDVGFNYYAPEGYLTSCSFDYLTEELRGRLMIFVFFVAAWVLPVSIIIFCYLNIYRAVVSVNALSLSSESCKHCKAAEKRRTEIKVAAVVGTIVGLWFFSWTPYAVVALLGATGHHTYLTPFASMVPALFCKAASCIDPYVYAVTHPRFRLELRTLVRHVSGRRSRNSLLHSRHQRPNFQVRRRSSVEEVMVDLSTLQGGGIYTLTTGLEETDILCKRIERRVGQDEIHISEFGMANRPDSLCRLNQCCQSSHQVSGPCHVRRCQSLRSESQSGSHAISKDQITV